MIINTNNSTEVAFGILSLVNSLSIQYGKATLSRILNGSESINIKHRNLNKNEYYGCLAAFSQEQINNIIQKLIFDGYLQNLNIGTDYEMIVVGVTNKGLDAIKNRYHIDVTLPKVYNADFKTDSQIEILDNEIIDEYYELKVQLNQLLKREEELKEIIKSAMVANDIPKVYTNKMSLFCKKFDMIIYPKDKIEEFVPENILEKIKTIKETVVLSVKLKIKI